MLSSCEAELVPSHNAGELGRLQRDVTQREREREGPIIDDGEEEEVLGVRGERGESCFSLSLIRTAPLVIGSACHTAEKSVAGACVRFCFTNLRTYKPLFFLFTTRLYERHENVSENNPFYNVPMYTCELNAQY